jgi:phytoene synthase
MNKNHASIFRRGSRTYFYSSLFFPEPLRSDVFALYAFVRKADDFVDALPGMPVEFHSFCASYREALK